MMINKILEIFFPKTCTICGKIYKNWICPKCYLKIKKELKYCIIKEKDFHIMFLGFYENNLRNSLLKFKFNEKAYLSNLFIEVIKKNDNFINCIKKYDYIIPVPMHKNNKKIRGYNQTEILAKKLAEECKIKYLENVLVKIRQNKRQSTLDRKQRRENVKDVYKLNNIESIKNKKILLMDDIYTTGNTVEACKNELKKGQAQEIDILVIAKKK